MQEELVTKQPIKVLIVGNSFERFDAILRALDASGFEVLFALGRHEALRAMRLERLDIILCDLCLPDNAGVELCQTLRRNELTADTCFVFTSRGYHNRQNVFDALMAGADDCIPASTELDHLVAKLVWLVEKRNSLKRRHDEFRMLQARQMQIVNIARQAARIIESIGRDDNMAYSPDQAVCDLVAPNEVTPNMLSSLADLLIEQVREINNQRLDRPGIDTEPDEFTATTFTEFTM